MWVRRIYGNVERRYFIVKKSASVQVGSANDGVFSITKGRNCTAKIQFLAGMKNTYTNHLVVCGEIQTEIGSHATWKNVTP